MNQMTRVTCIAAAVLISQPVSGHGPVAAGTRIPVVSDPSATYQLLRTKSLAKGNIEVLTRRDGKSGRSFSRREVNCRAMTFRYLGDGGTLKQALVNLPKPGRMSEAMSTSISGEVARFACKRR